MGLIIVKIGAVFCFLAVLFLLIIPYIFFKWIDYKLESKFKKDDVKIDTKKVEENNKK